MKNQEHGWPHGFVHYAEADIEAREIIIKMFTHELKKCLTNLNRAVRFFRVETPIIVPDDAVEGHVKTGFNLVKATFGEKELFIRPETTFGTYTALKELWPNTSQLKKQLPVVLWQSGKSFRNEQNRPFAELRFNEFYQLEYQLIASYGSEANYFYTCLNAAMEVTSNVCGEVYQEKVEDLAHYSKRTTDIATISGDHEVVAISERTDLEDCLVFEVSVGLDRLTALRTFMR